MFRKDIIKDGDTYRYGFLAAQAASILAKQGSISPGEVNRLMRARDFVRELISGTEVLTGGKTGSLATYEAMRAASFVLDPVESLRMFVKAEQSEVKEDSELIAIFKRIHDYLDNAISAGSMISSDDQKLAGHFFEWLSRSVLQSLSRPPSHELIIDKINLKKQSIRHGA